jgi:hypothetical protein
MTNTNNENILLQNITDLAERLGKSLEQIIDTAENLGVQFLVEIPDDSTIFTEITNNLFGHPIHSPPIKNNAVLFPGDPETRKLLCIPASSARSALKLNKIKIQQFMHAAFFSEEKEQFFNLTPKEFYRCESLVARNRAMNIKKFDYSQYNNPLSQLEIPDSTFESSSFLVVGKALTICPDDLILTKHDVAKINEIINETKKPTAQYPDYGKFKLGVWTSPMLANLNEASTLFISDLPPGAATEVILNTSSEIKKWLRAEWGETRGEALISESTNAILPNFHSNPQYKEKIKNIKSIKSENNKELDELSINSYASDILTAINIAAIYLHNLNDRTPVNNDKAIDVLRDRFGFKGRLAQSVSTIIRHSSRVSKSLMK